MINLYVKLIVHSETSYSAESGGQTDGLTRLMTAIGIRWKSNQVISILMGHFTSQNSEIQKLFFNLSREQEFFWIFDLALSPWVKKIAGGVECLYEFNLLHHAGVVAKRLRAGQQYPWQRGKNWI